MDADENAELRSRVNTLECVRAELTKVAISRCDHVNALKVLLDRARPQVDDSLARDIDKALGRS